MNALLLGAVALGDKIETFGAYFGYAAVIGLGVLSLLYFAQAKEVKRLREWAGRAPERDAELVQRAQSDVSRRVVAQPIVTQPGVAATAGPQTPAAQQAEAARKAAAAAVMQKFQPGGGAAVGGPPVVAPPGQLARPGGLGVPPVAASPSSPVPATGTGAGAGAAAAPGAPSAPGGPATVGPSPGPAVPPSAATADAVAAARQAAIAGRSPASSSNGDAHDPLNPPISPLPDVPSRQPRELALPSDRDGGRSASRIGLIVGGVFTVLAVAVAIVLLLSAGGDTPPKDNPLGNATPPAATKPPPPASAATQVNRRATQVAVLNGTFQNGLAASVASKIEDKGFTILSKGTNADQQVTTTSVSYASGHKPAALLVAKIVGVSAGAVTASDANASVAAGPDANVVVIIGADVASTG